MAGRELPQVPHSENYGIDKICDYLASIETNTKLIRNPARDQANAAVRNACYGTLKMSMKTSFAVSL